MAVCVHSLEEVYYFYCVSMHEIKCSRVNVHYGHQSCMLYFGSSNKNQEYVLLLELLYVDCLDVFNFSLIRSQFLSNKIWSECN